MLVAIFSLLLTMVAGFVGPVSPVQIFSSLFCPAVFGFECEHSLVCAFAQKGFHLIPCQTGCLKENIKMIFLNLFQSSSFIAFLSLLHCYIFSK